MRNIEKTFSRPTGKPWWPLGLLCTVIFLAWHTTSVQAETLKPIKILTLNLFAGSKELDLERIERQISEVRAVDADIITTQEAYDDRMIAAYRDAFPEYEVFVTGHVPVPTHRSYRALHWAHKALELASKLTGLARWSKGSRKIFDGDTYGLMVLLKKERIEVVAHASERFDIQAGRGLLRLLEAVKPKGFQWFEFKVDQVSFIVINTHLSNGVRNTRRAGQLAQIGERLERHAQENQGIRHPALFTGDTNADEHEPEMQLWHSTYFTDTAPGGAVTWDYEQNPLANTGNLKEPPQRLDYISIRNGHHHRFEVVDTETVFNQDGNFISDHNGVVSNVVLHPCTSLLTRLAPQS